MNNSNPFQIKTPEGLAPEEAVSLFVDVFTDYQKIKAQGHTFIMGPRGIGKSMIFRYLEPDCQCIQPNNTRITVDKLDFLGLYIPLRNAGFTKLTELARLERNAAHILNEHIMVTFLLHKVFRCLAKPEIYIDDDTWHIASRDYYLTSFAPHIPSAYIKSVENLKIHEVFGVMAKTMESLYLQAMSYTRKLSFTKELFPYDGPLFDYLDYVLPLISSLSTIPCFPQRTKYFLIDDAHCLTNRQTQILNFWVSTRTSSNVSLKISSQYNYKHFYTLTGETIDTPHDYSEVDMTTVYTGRAKPKYKERITHIIEKRLANASIPVSVDAFFPCDEEQENKIKEIAAAYTERFDKGQGQGNKRSDDALRYARPDFIRSWSGTSKSSHHYSYSGFDQLVHLSSGIVRYFLESAYIMYAEALSRSSDHIVTSIDPSIQNDVIREEANKFLFHTLPRYATYSKDERTDENACDDIDHYPKEDIVRLSNLIQALGGLFRQTLLSDRSERRVFSVAISDTPSNDVEKIFNLGIQLGYFHCSTIGRKDSKSGGRTVLYILNRRLSPIWTLDPTGFAGYLFVKNNLLEEAMEEPARLLRRLGKDPVQNDDCQLSLFANDDQEYSVEEGEE